MKPDEKQVGREQTVSLTSEDGSRLASAVTAEKRVIPSPAGSQKWLVTYSDLVTVILVFFVMLQIISDVSQSKFEQVFEQAAQSTVQHQPSVAREDQWDAMSRKMMSELAELMAQADDPERLLELLKQLLQSDGALATVDDLNQLEQMAELLAQAKDPASLLEQLKQMSQSDGQQDQRKQIKRLHRQIVKDIQRNKMQHLIDARTDPSYNTVIIQIKDRTLFESGRAELSPKGYRTIDKVVEILQPYRDFTVNIRGHTDNRPINTVRFPSNWELSSGRATSLLRYIIESGRIEPARMTATGFGEVMPIENNQTAAGRAKNRRVEFILQKVSH